MRIAILSRQPIRAGGKLTWNLQDPAPITLSFSTVRNQRCPILAQRGNPMAYTALRAWSITAHSSGRISVGRPRRSPAAFFMNCTSAPSLPREHSTAAIGRLDYLRGLGITHVELLPMAAFPGKHGWGYDGVDLFAVHDPYGGPDALKRFVNAAHGKGLAVLLDVVYNHFGPSGNYVGKYGPYFTHSHSTPWGDAVNLEDAGSHEVRRFFIDNALMWLRDYHIDGLRLDAVHAYMDRSAVNFMEQLAQEVRALEAQVGRWFVIIAESDLNDPRLVMAPEAGGYGLDAAWSDDFHHALVTLLTGMRARLLRRLRRDGRSGQIASIGVRV